MQLLQALLEKRRLFAPIILIVGIILIATQLWPAIARETELDLLLGPDHEKIIEVRLSFVQGDEEIRGVTFGFPKGAPATLKHRVDLRPGVYQVAIELIRGEQTRISERVVRALDAPARGVVRVKAY